MDGGGGGGGRERERETREREISGTRVFALHETCQHFLCALIPSREKLWCRPPKYLSPTSRPPNDPQVTHTHTPSPLSLPSHRHSTPSPSTTHHRFCPHSGVVAAVVAFCIFQLQRGSRHYRNEAASFNARATPTRPSILPTEVCVCVCVCVCV